MNYDEIALLISKQLVGTITDEQQQELAAWRSQNEQNEAAYQRLMDRERLTVEHVRHELTDYRRPLSDMKHRLDRQDGQPAATTARVVGGPLRWVAAAAMVLLLAGVAYVYMPRLTAGGEREQLAIDLHDYPEIQPGRTQATLTLSGGEAVELTAESELEQLNRQRAAKAAQGLNAQAEAAMSFRNLSTPRGGEFKVTLEDGTEVWLNAETTLRYPESFAAAERRVEVTGEAYFRVAKEADRPFYVVSGGQEVRVYGTEFNVTGYNDEPDIRTTLVVGSISLRPVAGNGSELMLTPGSQAVFSRSSESARVHSVDTEVVTSWRKGMFVFENQTMEQIMRTLGRWYNFDYEFASPEVAQTVLMGSIPRYSSFAEVADIFHKLGGLQLRQQGDKVVISTQK